MSDSNTSTSTNKRVRAILKLSKLDSELPDPVVEILGKADSPGLIHVRVVECTDTASFPIGTEHHMMGKFLEPHSNISEKAWQLLMAAWHDPT